MYEILLPLAADDLLVRLETPRFQNRGRSTVWLNLKSSTVLGTSTIVVIVVVHCSSCFIIHFVSSSKQRLDRPLSGLLMLKAIKGFMIM